MRSDTDSHFPIPLTWAAIAGAAIWGVIVVAMGFMVWITGDSFSLKTTAIVLSSLPIFVGAGVLLNVLPRFLPPLVSIVVGTVTDRSWSAGGGSAIYLAFGVLPLCVFLYGAAALSDPGAQPGWLGYSLYAGLAGLLMAAFSNPTDRDVLNLIISGLLIPMTATLMQLAVPWGLLFVTEADRPPFMGVVALSLMSSLCLAPVLVGLHFLVKQLKAWTMFARASSAARARQG
jgi:hypothetical protein